ncbi:MAG: toll/interleukin-1 receptor domain-containing protein [Acidobacteriota bacterium]
MHPFRVFISYSHEDRKLAVQVNDALRGMKLEPVWDKDIRPGTPFSDAIKGLIANAHLFMPLISENSQHRPWVHQETGYAMAINIPVLPVAFGNLPGEMISQLQAISVALKAADEFDEADLTAQLNGINIEQLVLSPPASSVAIVEVADYPEERTEMMARYANRVMERGSYGRLRQRGALSSFSIPNRVLSDPIWKLREGSSPRSQFYRNLQRNERNALEQHARQSGCSLMLDPEIDMAKMSKNGPTVMRARLSSLLEFLASMPDEKVQVVIRRRTQEGNVTILGDWFVSESQALRRGEGYRQTVFSWHAPTVLRELRKFDQEFEEYNRQSGLEPNASRRAAIARIEEVISGLPEGDSA